MANRKTKTGETLRRTKVRNPFTTAHGRAFLDLDPVDRKRVANQVFRVQAVVGCDFNDALQIVGEVSTWLVKNPEVLKKIMIKN